ncbi:hypothetical protein NP233_g6856 [Leucocoprinus birnbaumii]|uniref:Uncharacterized protein n=1 Tax=Leucocoprinus birnbaumii TaxID=56174 RepID=A0AAD5VTN0_9AGAR|nr:hypothetical protein NP233_g6856 [Leucocoprinus birnbaumii]
MPLRRNAQGHLILYPRQRSDSSGLQATDAKLIAELRSRYLTAQNKVTPESGGPAEYLVITTPNADWLPEVQVGQQCLTIHEDGRWGPQDYGQWPQWFFDGQDHFAYILRKPSPGALLTHPFRLVWWNMSQDEFVFEGSSEIGQLLPSHAKELHDIRVKLMKEVEACRCESGADYNRLQKAAWMMRNCTSTLMYTPQAYQDVLFILTSAQRAILETRALLDKINKWDKLPASEQIRPTDHSILGCVTDRIPLAYEMYAKGVPVWLVRPPSQISEDLTILAEAATTTPVKFGINTTILRNAPAFYRGPLARNIHESIQNWQPGSLKMNFLENITPVVDTDAPSTEELPQASSSKEKPYSRLSSSKPRAVVQKSLSPKSSRQFFSVREDRFTVVESPFSSRSTAQWNDALTRVNRDLKNVMDHPLFNLFRGFAYPPPRLFDTHDAGLAVAWLLIRPSWTSLISNPSRTLPLPNPSQWHNYLHHLSRELGFIAKKDARKSQPDASNDAGSSKVTKSARHARKQWEQSLQIFTVNVPPKDTVTTVVWNNHAVWRNGQVNFSVLDRQLITWDAQEHNFRLELWTLDRCVLAMSWRTPKDHAKRERKLRAMWPNDVMFSVLLPQHPQGLSSPKWEERLPYIRAFHDVLVDWPVSGMARLVDAASQGWVSHNLPNIEGVASEVYCQTFFSYFGRAACIPHIFPTL